MQLDDSRRRFVKRLGAVALVGSLAGCGGDGDSDTTEPGTTEPMETTDASTTTEPMETTTTATGTPTPTGTPTGTPTPTPTPTPVPGPDEYLSSVQDYDGMEDMTGQSSITVLVGSNYFDPPGIIISTGTTITWDWEGGSHNVVAEDTSFDSGDVAAGITFQHTFDTAGEFPYYCEPHKFFGMKGYITVED
jgi:halocyanin-like protein